MYDHKSEAIDWLGIDLDLPITKVSDTNEDHTVAKSRGLLDL